MEISKDEIVADLYALRAGLSVISQNADEIKECERAIIASENYKCQLELHTRQNESELNRKNKSKNQICANDYDELYKGYYKEAASYTEPILRTIIFAAITAPIIITIFSLIMRRLTFVGVIIGIAISAALAITFYIFRIKKTKSKAQEKLDEIKNKDLKTIQELDKEITSLKNELEKNNDFLNHYPQRLQEIKKDKDLTTKNNAEISNAINTALEKAYGSLLTPADWGNIDLVIFYLQSGRADSIKECLQLVDRQRQTEEIIDAISMAAISVTAEINRGFQMLGNTMVTCFNALSSQVNAIGTQMANQHLETLQALESIESQNKELLSAAKLGNALKAKANVTSEGLKTDLEFMQSKLGLNY